jgi:hypothetical protein
MGRQPPAGSEEDVVEDVGQKDPSRDRQLLQDHQPAADLSRRQLGDVGRHDHRGGPDGHPDDDPEHHEQKQGRRQRGRHRADRVDDRQHQQGIAAADAVGQLAAEDPTDDRADQDRRDGQLLAAGAQLPVGFEQVLGPRDDPDVIAEQHPADRRNAGDKVGVGRGGADHIPAK